MKIIQVKSIKEAKAEMKKIESDFELVGYKDKPGGFFRSMNYPGAKVVIEIES